ncbi:MAG: UDP-N-acetylmuramoyl-L-alanine--D-glutamate ligase [Bacteroidota bacterium]|jgi:UDP-N-acetylmuramoylalanine--D-glutamate ligase
MKPLLVILGAGESGAGTAVLGTAQGFRVWVSDKGQIADRFKREIEACGAEWEEGTHSLDIICAADVLVKSPGIPDTAAPVAAAIKNGISVLSEIEFAARYTDALLIGITGTNGKTTTTSLIYHILKQADWNVGLGGNIGQSFARQVAQEQHDAYVLELSSFQLDSCYDLRLDIAVLTNITPDHLERYGSMQAYRASKMRIAQNQGPEQAFIYCADDAETALALSEHVPQAKTYSFSLQNQARLGAWIADGCIQINTDNKHTTQIDMKDFTIRGQHNQNNSMAAAIVAQLVDVRKDSIRESLSHFENIEHRLEPCGKFKGIEFINDSKATNVNSAWYALESMDKPVIWIAGGVDKGNNYEDLKPLVRQKVKMIICLGMENIKIHQAFQSDVDMIINTMSAKEAVHVASRLASAGDAVLLSPACASFDLFDNYEDRGRQFKEAVRNL